MPFRTRDFALFLLTVAFLIVGITSTVQTDLVSENNMASVAVFDDTTSTSYEAVLPEPDVDNRPSKLASLKEKIASLVLTPVREEEVVEPEETETKPDEVTGEVLLCPNYSAPKNISWQPQGLMFEVVEGARLVYREGAPKATVNELGETVAGLPNRTVLLQLPLRSFPSSVETCLSSDLIGIALDGSLMRNTEQSLYTIFGAETLLGYALDGFPIYGTNESISTDSCGGATVAGSYRYYLSTERAGMISCFGGEPVVL